MNYYRTSTGERFSNTYIEGQIRKAKAQKLQTQLDEYGYNFCTICLRNDCKPLDCSHNKSVKWCKENGYVELAWDLDNIEIIGRTHHQEKDGLDLRFSTKNINK